MNFLVADPGGQNLMSYYQHRGLHSSYQSRRTARCILMYGTVRRRPGRGYPRPDEEDRGLALRQLANYTNIDGMLRIFHFLAIEAKMVTMDNKGRLQCLNNTSQSLHNRYEHFREAGEDHSLTNPHSAAFPVPLGRVTPREIPAQSVGRPIA